VKGEWKNYVKRDLEISGANRRIPGTMIESLAADLDGRMWYGFYEAGACCREKDGTLTRYTTADGPGQQHVWGIWADDDGTMWFNHFSARPTSTRRSRREKIVVSRKMAGRAHGLGPVSTTCERNGSLRCRSLTGSLRARRLLLEVAVPSSLARPRRAACRKDVLRSDRHEARCTCPQSSSG